MDSSQNKVKVVYIGGFERSGSTFLTKILGELDDTFAVGELRGIWWTSFLRDQDCGCGLPFSQCPIWSEVTQRVFGGFDQVDYQWMIKHRPRRRHTPVMLFPRNRRLVSKLFGRYIATLDRLYAETGRVTGSRILVDSSKTPLHSYVLGLAPSIDLYIVHLVRDARGVQSSNLRGKRNGNRVLQSHNLFANTLLWDVINVCQELFGRSEPDRYLRVRYEDLVESPIQVVEQIKNFIGEPSIGLPSVQDGRILLGTNHIMNGNHNRFETGSVPVRSASSWRNEIDGRARSMVTCLTFPLLRRYGYL